VHVSIPIELLEEMNIRQGVLENAGGPIQIFVASRWLRNKSIVEVAKFIHDHRLKDGIAQWEKVKNAQDLAFIAPTFWLPFPAILKGWFERVFAYGHAYALTPVDWQGNSSGRVPLLHHQKALVISTTLFREEDYKAAWELPMTRIIDDWGLRYPGVKKVEHVYFLSDTFNRR
jgi:putative NADPH-quinone reductase